MMMRTVMKSKLHRATVTEANLNYVGSITIDEALLEAADIWVNERVQVVNLTNGQRLETYAIKGARESGVIGVNGPAARLVQVGDKVIIITYAATEEPLTPKVVLLDEDNRISRLSIKEKHGEGG